MHLNKKKIALKSFEKYANNNKLIKNYMLSAYYQAFYFIFLYAKWSNAADWARNHFKLKKKKN